MNIEKEFLHVINYIETTFPVNKWNIKGVDVWPLVRIELGFKTLTEARPTSNEEFKTDSTYKLPKASLLFEENESIDAFIFFDSFTRTKLNECWFSRLTGMFNEEIRKMGLRAVNLEYNYNGIEKLPVCDESYSITNQLKYIQNGMSLDKITSLENYEEVKKLWALKFGRAFDFPTIENIHHTVAHIYKLSLIFETLLLRKKTKAVFMVPYYYRDSYALILAARRIGIPSIDIQHGNQRAPFYHKWVNLPKEGYNTMPNYFWCWREQEQVYFQEWTNDSKVHSAINGGNPWIELWKDNNHPIVKQADLSNSTIVNPHNVNILVTLQPLYGLKDWNHNIPSWLIEVINYSPDNWKWYIRYHHSMIATYRQEIEQCETLLKPYILAGKVETQYATSIPLMALLRKMTVHVTAFSTCVIEAMSLQVPSITLHKQAKYLFKNEFLSGLVSFATNIEEFVSEINGYVKKKKNGLLSNIEVNHIGLSKGLHDIFNNELAESIRYVEESNYTLVEKEFYFADCQFGKVIELYEQNPVVQDAFIAGRAYEKLQQLDSAAICYQQFLDYLLYEQQNLNEYLNELLAMKKFYMQYQAVKPLETIYHYIHQIISEHEDLRNALFKLLFQNTDFKEIKYWQNKVDKTVDVCFFSGRALLALGEIDEGIVCLEQYFQLISETNKVLNGLTNQLTYKISAAFYLGENYMKLNNTEKAKEYFNMCLVLSKGQHEKAKQYLDMLSS